MFLLMQLLRGIITVPARHFFKIIHRVEYGTGCGPLEDRIAIEVLGFKNCTFFEKGCWIFSLLEQNHYMSYHYMSISRVCDSYTR